jgi:adenosine deaminase
MTRDPQFYQASIDALSMRNFAPGMSTGETSGHDHTFAVFPRFASLMTPHLGEALAVTREQAAADHVQYVEQITDPAGAFAPALLNGVAAFSPADFDADYRQVAPLLPFLVAAARTEYDAAEAKMRSQLACGTAQAKPGCDVAVHYLFFVLRTLPPSQVFAQIALGYALSAADPRFAGVNLVAPEDDPVALRDFELQMRMFRYFHARDPKVKLSLHAGELWLGLVPPSELGFHIRDTIGVAGASRIGHGYELPFERDAAGLLREMAQKKIAVEINLTSNAISPGVKGGEHPLHMYMRAGVPFSLSADDEGVFRIDLTGEYVRAVLEQNLTYADLKTSARNGLEFSFLQGPSLWAQTPGGPKAAPCGQAGPSCDSFLNGSEKARLEAALERAFARFEGRAAAGRIVP